MKLFKVIEIMKDGHYAKANFAGIEGAWYIKKSVGVFRYCDKNGEDVGDIIGLTMSNLEAEYEIINE